MEEPSRIELKAASPVGIAMLGAALLGAVVAGVEHPATGVFAIFVVAFPLFWIGFATILTSTSARALRMAEVDLPSRTRALSTFRLRATIALRDGAFPAIGVLTNATFATAGAAIEAGPWAELPIVESHRFAMARWDVTTNRRGILFVGPFRVAVDLPGSALRATAVFDTKHAVTVLPAIYHLQPFVDALLAGRHTSVGRFEKRPAAIEEYVGVREYRPGDSPKLIHRVLSLRTRAATEFFVREFRDPTREDVSLVLDTAAPLDGNDALRQYRLEKAICFAYALCRTFAARRLAVRFIFQRSARDVTTLRILPQDVDLDRLQAQLARVELKGDRTTLQRVLVDEVRRHGAAIIFVSLRSREQVEMQRFPIVTLTPEHVPAFTSEVERQC
jgi:uncharacterized protein (DUF58 family)